MTSGNEGHAEIRALRAQYITGRDALGTDFFGPCLRHCSRYRRASGYFTSSALVTWSSALPSLASKEDIRIQLLIAPILTDQDREVLRRASEESERRRLREVVVDRVIGDALVLMTSPDDSQRRLDLFAWMVANDRLTLRFAFPHHVEDADMYHQKIGVFDFPWGDSVAFTGSANETGGGHVRNWESVDVYRSWVEGDRERVVSKSEQFDEEWEGRTPGLEIQTLTPALLERIQRLAPTDRPGRKSRNDASQKWRHQDLAVAGFLAVKHGILEMATGTGKTRTALKILSALLQAHLVDGAIIATTGTDLLKQWASEVYRWLASSSHGAFSVYQHFDESHDAGRFAAHPERSLLIINRDQLPALFKGLSAERRGRLFLVHDEVHGLGSEGARRSLAGEHAPFVYRLGLSATPEREYDAVGTAFLLKELGPVFFKFDLADAIRRGVLCEFDYVPLTYPLTDGDRQRLRAVHMQRAARAKTKTPMPNEEFWQRLAAIYKTAEAKPGVFEQHLREHPEVLTASIIFVHSKEFGDQIVDLVHKHTPRFGTYYADDHEDRLRAFARGDLDCLITCHRLSQGVDFRHLQTVVLLAADRARLETIQRIGRCLRTDPENPKKRAVVVDFIRAREDDDQGDDSKATSDDARCQWLSELASIRCEEPQ